MKPQRHDWLDIPGMTDSGNTRRRDPRLKGQLNLTFSGMDANHMLLEAGVTTNLSQDGMGIRSDRPLKSGMELAIFVHCPDSDDHVCIPEARVAWVDGGRFGVSIRMIKPDDQERLQQIFASARHEALSMS
jgi:hypothetical protein